MYSIRFFCSEVRRIEEAVEYVIQCQLVKKLKNTNLIYHTDFSEAKFYFLDNPTHDNKI